MSTFVYASEMLLLIFSTKAILNNRFDENGKRNYRV